VIVAQTVAVLAACDRLVVEQVAVRNRQVVAAFVASGRQLVAP
jgi:hypothetical protein